MTIPRALRLLGLAVALVQFAALILIARHQYSHYQLSGNDFGTFEQARQLIAHGELNPNTSLMDASYWTNHGEAIMWPLAWISRVTFDGTFFLLLIQALATAAAAYFIVSWLVESWERRQRPWTPTVVIVIVGCAAVALVDPWIYIADAFDFHFEALAALLLILLARAIDRHSLRSMYVIAAITLLIGDVAGTYVAALGVTAVFIFARRKQGVLPGVVLIVAGLLWTFLMGAIGADHGSNLDQFYAYLTTATGTTAGVAKVSLVNVLTGIVAHPLRALDVVPRVLPNDWANIGAPGLLGAFSPWALPLTFSSEAFYSLIGGPNSLGAAYNYSEPCFQSIAFYPLITVSTGLLILAAITSRRSWLRRAAQAVGAVAIAQSFVWAAVFTTRLPSYLNHHDDSQSQALARVQSIIGSSAETFIDNGVAGRFTSRHYVYVYGNEHGTGTGDRMLVPIGTHAIYFASSLSNGLTPSASYVGAAARLPGARVVFYDRPALVVLVRWVPPAGTQPLTLAISSEVPAWLLPSATAEIVKPAASASSWYMRSDGSRAGAVIWSYGWPLSSGPASVSARLATSGPVQLQLWNATTGAMVQRRWVTARSVRSVGFLTTVRTGRVPSSRLGHGIFSYDASAPSQLTNDYTITIWAPKGVRASIYSVALAQGAGVSSPP